MGKNDKLLEKIISGKSDKNIPFAGTVTLLKKLGYIHVRTTGSHMFYKHPDFNGIINIQPDGDKVKKYQVQQIRMHILKNDIRL